MARKNNSPRDLAQAMWSALRKRGPSTPGLRILNELFESMYSASLRTEESQRIAFHVVYLNPKNPDPNPPLRIRQQRWSCVRLAHPVKAAVPNLLKIAKASDPRTSSFAVYHDPRGRPFVWGLIDQGNEYHDFVNYESDSGPERPGLFSASIVGVGHLVAHIGYEKVAELKIDALLRDPVDVLWRGDVGAALGPGIRAYIERVRRALPKNIPTDSPAWAASLPFYWISSLCRILLRVQNYRHGGALLISPDPSFHGLNLKYGFPYTRLRSALDTHARLRIQEDYASGRIFEEYLKQAAKEIPIDLYRSEFRNRHDLEDNRSELEGAIWFVSLLTRVDGLVLMNPTLQVLGFGVEITLAEAPRNVFLATSNHVRENRLRRVDYDHFGTRHRSMMRYCALVPGSVGFVISQDGDLRVMTQVNGRLVMWENIKLRLYENLVLPGTRRDKVL